MSDPEKIRRKNEIQGDFSKQAQQVEQDALAKQKALAEERARMEALAAQGLEEKARRAEEAKKRAEELEKNAVQGAGTSAVGATAVGAIREELAGKQAGSGLLGDALGMGMGTKERMETLMNSYARNLPVANNESDVKRQAEIMLERAQKSGIEDPEYKAANDSIISRLQQAIQQITEGEAAKKAMADQGAGAKATAEELGDPDSIRKEAEAKRKAAADAEKQAKQFSEKSVESGLMYEFNQQRETVVADSAVAKAEKQEKEKQDKERKAAEKEAEALRAAQSGLRELSSLLPANSAAAGVASGSGGSVEQLTAIVEKLIVMMGKSSAVKGSPIEKKIQQLEQRVNALRQADKP